MGSTDQAREMEITSSLCIPLTTDSVTYILPDSSPSPTSALRGQHNVVAQIGDRPFKCSICGKTFVNNGHFNRHIVSHSEDKLFECSTCGKKFRRERNLTIHSVIHSGERQWECSMCDMTFSRKESLDAHGPTHTGLKPFECPICGRKFSWKQCFRRHMNTHSQVRDRPFDCSTRGKTFTTKKILMVTHRSERPFECSVCNKTFPLKLKRERHLGIHRGEMPWECSTCGEKYTSKDELKRHIETHWEEMQLERSTLENKLSAQADLSDHGHFEEGPGGRTLEDVEPDLGSIPSTVTLHRCPHCCQEFGRRFRLKKHLLGHCVDSDFRCVICNNCAFRTKFSLSMHIRINHTVLGL